MAVPLNLENRTGWGMWQREKSTARNGCATKHQQQTRKGNQELLGVLLFSFCTRGESAARNRWGTQEFSAGTGPIPIFGFGGEIGADGIPFDVITDALEFSGISDPMIEGLILPKGFAYAVQSGVGVPRGHSFHDAGDFRKGPARFQQDMNMVGHDHERVQLVAAKLGAAQDGIFGVSSNFGIGQPARADGCRIQSGVEQLESLARRIFVFSGTAIPGCAGCPDHSGRQGTMKSPRQENGTALRMPVWKIAAIEGHVMRGPFSAAAFLNSTERAQPRMAVPQDLRNRWGCVIGAGGEEHSQEWLCHRGKESRCSASGKIGGAAHHKGCGGR
jgi:hypothetical protein